MEQRIIIFYFGLYIALRLLILFPQSIATRIAFSWLGPLPREGETYARYQLRWAIYSLDWLGQIAFLLTLFYGAAHFYPSVPDNQWFLVFASFALPIGGGVALIAAVGFFLKAAKATYFGPNPVFLA